MTQPDKKGTSTRVNLDNLLPYDGDEDITLGYPDFSQGAATSILEEMSPEDLRITHKYAELRRVGFIEHVDFLVGLVNGLHEHDPKRRSQEAVRLAEAEIKGSRDHFRLLGSMQYVPCIVSVDEPEGFSEDAMEMGWYLYQAKLLS